jgi:hypothetical protein
VHTSLSSAVLNLESDTCSVNRSLAHGHEFHTLQLAHRDTVTIYRNPARSVPGETLIIAGNDDPSVQPILTKFHPHAIHTMHRALGRSPLARCSLLWPPSPLLSQSGIKHRLYLKEAFLWINYGLNGLMRTGQQWRSDPSGSTQPGRSCT